MRSLPQTPAALAAAIAAGGALGAIARLGLDAAMPVEPGRWPWATLAANLIACALLGVVSAALVERPGARAVRRPAFLGTGFCGGLSTFSALQVEALSLGGDGHLVLAAAYLAVSVGGGLLLVTLGASAVRRAVAAPA